MTHTVPAEAPDEAVTPSASFEYYNGTIYWNDFEAVREYINLTISGQAGRDWVHHLRECHDRFRKVFSINCGNGWVERDLYRADVVEEIVGIDFSEKSITEAQHEAEAMQMPATYMAADCNTFDPCGLEVELAINHAAMHHVAYLNRMTHRLAEMIGPNGYYVGFDYVGPHRNQYSWAAWSAMLELRQRLPEKYRTRQTYPHMRTMLVTDPTEAIHSELQVEVMHRYFDVTRYVPLGGPIAYQLLYENRNLFSERHTSTGAAALDLIIEADRDFVIRHPEHNLFAFWMAKSKPRETYSPHLAEWQTEEDRREISAAQNGGRYYPPTALELIYNEFEESTRSI